MSTPYRKSLHFWLVRKYFKIVVYDINSFKVRSKCAVQSIAKNTFFTHNHYKTIYESEASAFSVQGFKLASSKLGISYQIQITVKVSRFVFDSPTL